MCKEPWDGTVCKEKQRGLITGDSWKDKDTFVWIGSSCSQGLFATRAMSGKWFEMCSFRCPGDQLWGKDFRAHHSSANNTRRAEKVKEIWERQPVVGTLWSPASVSRWEVSCWHREWLRDAWWWTESKTSSCKEEKKSSQYGKLSCGTFFASEDSLAGRLSLSCESWLTAKIMYYCLSLSYYGGDQKPWPNPTWVGKGLFHSVSYNSPSSKAVRAGTQAEQELGGRSWCRGREWDLLTGLISTGQLAFLWSTGTSAWGDTPTVSWAAHINYQLENCPTYLLTVQSMHSFSHSRLASLWRL